MDTVLVSVISGIVGIIATLMTLHRNSKSDTKDEAENNTLIKEEVKYISRGVEDIKFDTKTIMSNMFSMNERLIRTEEGLKNVNEKLENHIKKGD